MYTSAPGSIERHLEYIQDWLVQIAGYTREARDAMSGRGATAPKKEDDSRFDRWAKRIETAIQSGINAKLGQAQALATRGFAGTAESARYEFAMEQLGKQFAAVMSPILNGFTYAAVEVERRLRALNGAQQNGLMGGLVGAGVGARFGGVPGAIAGFGVGSALAGGGSVTGNLASTAGAAWLGMRTAGPIGALFAGTAAAAASAPGSYESERPSDYYSRMRRGGATMLGAAFSTGGESISRVFSAGRPGAPPVPGAPVAPRRDVTPFSADPMAAGGTADLIQKALIRATAGADFAEDNPMKPLIDIGIRLIEILLAIAGGTGVVVPASAADAR